MNFDEMPRDRELSDTVSDAGCQDSTQVDSGEQDAPIGRDDRAQKRPKMSDSVRSGATGKLLGLEDDGCGLTPRQANVLDLLVTGVPATKAAQMGGIARSTLYEWMKQDAFQAMLNRGRRERFTAVQTQVEALTPLAVNAVAQSLASGNERLGLQLLQGLGFLNGERAAIGSSDPAEVAAARKNNNQYQQIIKEFDRSLEATIRECIG